MTEASKQLYAEQKAREAIANWRFCPLRELEDAAKIYDGALLLLINRYAATLRG